MTYLAFEVIQLDRVRTECNVSYLDHNLLYVDSKTSDEHAAINPMYLGVKCVIAKRLELSANEIDVVLSGGQLRYLKKQLNLQNN